MIDILWPSLAQTALAELGIPPEFWWQKNKSGFLWELKPDVKDEFKSGKLQYF